MLNFNELTGSDGALTLLVALKGTSPVRMWSHSLNPRTRTYYGRKVALRESLYGTDFKASNIVTTHSLGKVQPDEVRLERLTGESQDRA
jgi:hypothetical protein